MPKSLQLVHRVILKPSAVFRAKYFTYFTLGGINTTSRFSKIFIYSISYDLHTHTIENRKKFTSINSRKRIFMFSNLKRREII